MAYSAHGRDPRPACEKPVPSGTSASPIANAAGAAPPLASVFALDASLAPAAMAPGDVRVALFEVRDWTPWVAQAPSLLDAAELARVARRRRPEDRANLALAYALHRLFLAAMLGLAPREVPLERDDKGCPRLRGLDVGTSLSHADAFLAMAVCRAGPVGVDIEPTERRTLMAEIAESLCHPHEAERLAGIDADRRADELLALWVRKEAFLKAEGIGLEREMATFVAPEGAVLPLTRRPGLPVRLRMIDTGPCARAAVASPADGVLSSAWLRPSPGAA